MREGGKGEGGIGWGGGYLSALDVGGVEDCGGEPCFGLQSDVWDLEWGGGWRRKGEVGVMGGEGGGRGVEEETDVAFVLYGSQTGAVEEYAKQV